MMGNPLKILFCMNVPDASPFIRCYLPALYPYAHQPVIFEGACPSAEAIGTPDGHFTDSTLETSHASKNSENPQDKLVIVAAQDEVPLAGMTGTRLSYAANV